MYPKVLFISARLCCGLYIFVWNTLQAMELAANLSARYRFLSSFIGADKQFSEIVHAFCRRIVKNLIISIK